MSERTLAEQAKARLRRIEGQVRGIQGMLDRVAEEPATRQSLDRRVRDMLAQGGRQAEVAHTLGISRRRVSEIARGRGGPEGEPCDDLLTQLLAVRSAVEQVGLMIMELHLQRCVLGGGAADDERLRDLRRTLTLWSRLTSTAPKGSPSRRTNARD